MGNLKGTRTEMNLNQAATVSGLSGDLYQIYAQIAEAEGLIPMAKMLKEMGEQKLMHAKAIHRALGAIGTTRANLEHLLKLEHEIWTKVAPQYAADAHAEGLEEEAVKIERVGAISKANETTLNTFLNQLDMTEVMKSTETMWRCSICGNIEKGDFPPQMCPICDGNETFEELKKEIIKYLTNK